MTYKTWLCGAAPALSLALVAIGTIGFGQPDAPEPADVDPLIGRMEELARENRMPSYQDLRIGGEGSRFYEQYLQSMPLMSGDVVTTSVVFSEVPVSEPFAEQSLGSLIAVALERSFDLETSARDVEIAASSREGEEAFFLPFVDLVGATDVSRTQSEDVRVAGRTTDQEVRSIEYSAGLEVTQNLPTGGSVILNVDESFTTSETDNGPRDSVSSDFSANARVALTQPLLRGSGILTGEGLEIGTANLRQARLSELNQQLANALDRRDTVLSIIRTYFQILQIKQQLLVSQEAIGERFRFLDETRIKYEVGRVAESEILRAEINFLSEIETAISRQQSLDDARDSLLLEMGLPLDTPISVVDITSILVDRGRVDIPPVTEAVQLALSNRYELMQSDLTIERTRIDRQVARNNVLPNLDLSAGYSRFDSGNGLDDANEFSDDALDAGLELRIPLQNIQRREASRRAQLRLDNSETNRLQLERQITRAVFSSHRDVLTTEARLTVLRKRVEQARKNLELINESFEVGFATITEVRLAQDDLFSAETAYSNAVLNYQVSIAELYVAMGLDLI